MKRVTDLAILQKHMDYYQINPEEYKERNKILEADIENKEENWASVKLKIDFVLKARQNQS